MRHYDPAFRLKSIYKNINNATSDQLIDNLQYNELGQLRAKYLGNNIDSLVYAYNIRGWLTGINPNYVAGSGTNYFGMELGYDKTTSVAPGNTYTTQEYNGNIEGTVWKTAGSGGINRKYDFSYDNVNRLTGGNFNQYNGSGFDKSAGIDFSVNGLNYDANGNIMAMRQMGFKVGGSVPIDVLTYGYGSTPTNQLQGVADSANSDSTLLGDFHFNPATKQVTDYAYDGNGNLHSDNNKVIDSIGYNYLNLPQYVHMKGKGTIVYTYDAGGTRWKKTITDSLAKHSTTILYLSDFVYQQVDSITNPDGGVDTLQFMAHEEGRTRWAAQKSTTTGTIGYSFQYDFFEKDHLGNTRMVLTQERDTTNYLASMEAAYRSTESQIFGNIASTCVAWSSVPNYQNIPSGTRTAITNPNDSVSKVDYTGSGGQTTGPSLLLKVMSGDTVKLGVQSYYNSNTATTTNSSFTSVLNSLASALLGTSTGAAEGGFSGYTASTSPVYGAISSFLSTNDPAPASGYPKAYLNWILLDDQFNYVSSSSGSVQAASSTYPAGQLNPVAPGGQVVMSRNGYLYVWVSNETQGWDVFFDNLSVQYKQGPILEENHYYPFGLTMAGISDQAVKTQYAVNKYRFNGGDELQNKEFSDGSGLELYDADFRGYDPQLGRFWQIDPLGSLFSDWSPYVFANDNPILLNDPLGLADDSAALVPAPKPKPLPKPVCIKCTLPKPDVAKAAGPAPTHSNVHAGGDDHGTLWHLWNDHNVVTDIAYEVNSVNLLAKGYDLVSTMLTGHDSYGVQQTNTQAATNLAVTLPMGRIGEGVLLVEQGITVLGSYGKYLELGEQLGAKTFNIPDAVWNTLTEDQKWAANIRFLNRAISRGDRIVLSNSAFEAKAGTYFYRELQYLYSKGYKVASNGMELIK
jgi:RHS repeat-associated protein